MNLLVAAAQSGGRALLGLIYPEMCVFCGAECGDVPWSEKGPVGIGLMWCDGPHLCRECELKIAPHLSVGCLPHSQTPVVAGRRTGPELVAAIAQWKYHGLRGLAWPLSRLLRPALELAEADFGPVDFVVPIPLHRRRERARGFNQAEVLANLIASDPLPMNSSLLYRPRATRQQAKLVSEAARQANLLQAFAAKSRSDHGGGGRIGLVDDLVTGGMTCEAAVSALLSAGWEVSWVVCLGRAKSNSEDKDGQVDRSAAEI